MRLRHDFLVTLVWFIRHCAPTLLIELCCDVVLVSVARNRPSTFIFLNYNSSKLMLADTMGLDYARGASR